MKAALAWKEPGAETRYQGDPVAGVAAETEERGRDAARLVKVQFAWKATAPSANGKATS